MSFTSYPYDTVVYITDTIAGVQYQGSGVLISPDEVLTASHVVYSFSGGPAYDITVIPAYDGSVSPFGSANGTQIHYNQILNFDDSISFADSQNDYAVIHLSQPFAGLGVMGIEPNYYGQQVNVTGYPAIDGGTQITEPESVTLGSIPYSLYVGFSIGAGAPVAVRSGSILPAAPRSLVSSLRRMISVTVTSPRSPARRSAKLNHGSSRTPLRLRLRRPPRSPSAERRQTSRRTIQRASSRSGMWSSPTPTPDRPTRSP